MRCGTLYSQKSKLWIWKAYCRTTGELIDRECGNRDTQTFKRLYNRLKLLNVKMYYADTWDSYAELIDPAVLLQTKAETWGIENNNGRQRRRFARFRRRTCVVSRCAVMVDLTMFLFAYFYVNNKFSNITQI
ncbi:MAG: hypothetical protein LBP62_00695 [Clostridiales bacterium]|jgi:insertion element IS1 protein InsB|nr:hypothetical protein [Clostridiales bacterium]